MYNALNYTEQGGAKTVVGGELVVTGTLTLTGATVEGVVTAPVIDSLVSTSATSALSAKQGKALKDAADLLATDVSGKLTASQVANQLDSTATTAAGIVTDFNLLLVKLKASGLMAADA